MKVKITILTIMILSILFLRNCFNKDTDFRDALEPKENSFQSEEYLMSSGTYFIGRWDLSYLDIVNYKYDDNGKPLFDVFKQADTCTFQLVNEQLIIEDTFPVVKSQYNGKEFEFEVDNKVLYLIITGTVEDKIIGQEFLSTFLKVEN